MKITGIRKRPNILPDGRFMEVYEISFTWKYNKEVN